VSLDATARAEDAARAAANARTQAAAARWLESKAFLACAAAAALLEAEGRARRLASARAREEAAREARFVEMLMEGFEVVKHGRKGKPLRRLLFAHASAFDDDDDDSGSGGGGDGVAAAAASVRVTTLYWHERDASAWSAKRSLRLADVFRVSGGGQQQQGRSSGGGAAAGAEPAEAGAGGALPTANLQRTGSPGCAGRYVSLHTMERTFDLELETVALREQVQWGLERLVQRVGGATRGEGEGEGEGVGASGGGTTSRQEARELSSRSPLLEVYA
jgi:hypothetical protein